MSIFQSTASENLVLIN